MMGPLQYQALQGEIFGVLGRNSMGVELVSRSWRYGWLLIGVVGLMILVNWPEASREQNLVPDQVRPQSDRLADQLARIEALQKPWLDALWRPEPSAVSRILAAGVDPDSVLDELENRPLHLLFIGEGCRRDQRPTAAATLTVLQLLLAAGADPNARDSRNNTPLMLAVAHCDAQVITQLVTAGSNPDQVNSRGLTAFEMTLSSPGDAAYALLEAGFRLNSEKVQRYQKIYADEAPVIALLTAARPEPVTP